MLIHFSMLLSRKTYDHVAAIYSFVNWYNRGETLVENARRWYHMNKDGTCRRIRQYLRHIKKTNGTLPWLPGSVEYLTGYDDDFMSRFYGDYHRGPDFLGCSEFVRRMQQEISDVEKRREQEEHQRAAERKQEQKMEKILDGDKRKQDEKDMKIYGMLVHMSTILTDLKECKDEDERIVHYAIVDSFFEWYDQSKTLSENACIWYQMSGGFSESSTQVIPGSVLYLLGYDKDFVAKFLEGTCEGPSLEEYEKTRRVLQRQAFQEEQKERQLLWTEIVRQEQEVEIQKNLFAVGHFPY